MTFMDLMNSCNYGKHTQDAATFSKNQIAILQMAAPVLEEARWQELGTNLVTVPEMVEQNDQSFVRGAQITYDRLSLERQKAIALQSQPIVTEEVMKQKAV